MMSCHKKQSASILFQCMPCLLILFSSVSIGDGVNGPLGQSSVGALSLNLQITESGRFVINPGTPLALAPAIFIKRLEPVRDQQSADLTLCLVAQNTNQYQVDTVFLNDRGNLQLVPAEMEIPYSISVGDAKIKASQTTVRAVQKDRCSHSNALQIFSNMKGSSLASTFSNQEIFKLLLQAE